MQTNKPPENPIEKKLFTVEDFLTAFSTSRFVFYQQVKKGLLKTRKLGRRTYIRPEDAKEWVDNLPENEQ